MKKENKILNVAKNVDVKISMKYKEYVLWCYYRVTLMQNDKIYRARLHRTSNNNNNNLQCRNHVDMKIGICISISLKKMLLCDFQQIPP